MDSALVAAIAALAGVLLGKFLEARTDQRSWLREKRHEAYVRYLIALHRSWMPMGRIFHRAADSDDATLLRALLTELETLESEIQIIGPTDVAATATAAWDAHQELVNALALREPEGERLRESDSMDHLAKTVEGAAFTAAERRFVETASALLDGSARRHWLHR